MKRLIAICLLLVAMTTATFAGSGITATVQNRVLTVQVVDNHLYNVAVLSETNKFIDANPMTHKSATFNVDIPQGNDYIELVVTNVQTGATETIRVHVE